MPELIGLLVGLVAGPDQPCDLSVGGHFSLRYLFHHGQYLVD